MKRLIILSLLGLLFLTGCGNKLTIEHINDSAPEIKIAIWTWTMLAEFWSKVQNEVSRTASEEEQENWRKKSVVSWYLYTYTYKDLWIKVTTPPLYEPYFFEKTNESIYARYKNMIYPSRRWNTWWWDYIAVFEKNSQTPLSQEITNNHLGTWCKIETGIFDKKTTHYESMIGFDVVYIIDKDSQTACSVYDTQFPQREMPLVFVMNPDKPEKYYKLAIGDGCAPGPCTIFWTIEFF